MRLVTIAPRGAADPVAPAEAGPPVAAPLEVAILTESGAALTMTGLARIAAWPVSAGLARLSLAELLAADTGLASIRAAYEAANPAAVTLAALPAGSFRFAAPIPNPGKAIGVGYNYLEHVREQGLERPARPVLFSMFANAVTGDGEPIRHPAGTHALDLEAELAVVIGRRASRVAAADAMDYVAGFTAANDVTARDWQGQAAALRPGEQGDRQWLRAKGSDTFLPLGPILVTADEVRAAGSLGDGKGLRVRSWVVKAGAPGVGATDPGATSAEAEAEAAAGVEAGAETGAAGPTGDDTPGAGVATPPAPPPVTPNDAATPTAGAATPPATPRPGVPFLMQDGNTADLIFGVVELIAMISAEVTLEPGDVIVTGTPSGVGVFRTPQVFLAPGDLVRVEVDGIGTLTNPVTDADGSAPAGSPAARFIASGGSENAFEAGPDAR
jgi:2-keto-4-pentenoate hydratase/2-oxohepta-3-ene-1,7-dioic acid hydratase in catechol pathway